jgi:hypothetical protein
VGRCGSSCPAGLRLTGDPLDPSDDHVNEDDVRRGRNDAAVCDTCAAVREGRVAEFRLEEKAVCEAFRAESSARRTRATFRVVYVYRRRPRPGAPAETAVTYCGNAQRVTLGMLVNGGLVRYDAGSDRGGLPQLSDDVRFSIG